MSAPGVKPINIVLERLEAVRPTNTGWKARCPAHDDRNPSLSIGLGDENQVLLRCHTGCELESIVQALKLEVKDLWPESESRSLPKLVRTVHEKRYPIRDETGYLYAYHVRLEKSDGSKTFRWLQPDERTWNLNGHSTTVLPLYGTDDLPSTANIIVTEGEKAADALRSIGIRAVATVTGANAIPNPEALEPLLRYKAVYLWPDHDREGIEHMRQIANRLSEMGQSSVRRLGWAGAPPKGDADDFIAVGHTKADVFKLADEAREWEEEELTEEPEPSGLRFISAHALAQETPRDVNWIAKPWIVRGGITEFDGKVKAAGKTTFILAMCKAILEGQPFLGEATVKMPVVYLTEQPRSSFREALRRADLLEHEDLTLLFWHDAIGESWADIIEAAAQEAKRQGSSILIVDTLPPFAGIKGDAENDSGAAQEAMEPLQQASGQHDLAIVLARHERKSGGDVGDSARGSSAFAGAVDIIVSIRRGEGNQRPTVRVLNSLSRFDETPDTLTIEWTPHGYESLGDERAVTLEDTKRAIVDVLPATEEDALSEQDLRSQLSNYKRTTIQYALKELDADQLVLRTGLGKRGNPYRFYTPHDSETLSAALKGEVPAERNQGGLM